MFGTQARMWNTLKFHLTLYIISALLPLPMEEVMWLLNSRFSENVDNWVKQQMITFSWFLDSGGIWPSTDQSKVAVITEHPTMLGNLALLMPIRVCYTAGVNGCGGMICLSCLKNEFEGSPGRPRGGENSPALLLGAWLLHAIFRLLLSFCS